MQVITVTQNSSRRKHGHTTHTTSSPTYNSWHAMWTRIKDPIRYPWYKNISVCTRWLAFANFLADMGERPAGKTLDRYPNGAGNYEPTNCRWATPREQNLNQFKRVKLNAQDVAWIRWLRTEGNCSGRKVAEMYNVSQVTISAIHTKRTWNA